MSAANIVGKVLFPVSEINNILKMKDKIAHLENQLKGLRDTVEQLKGQKGLGDQIGEGMSDIQPSVTLEPVTKAILPDEPMLIETVQGTKRKHQESSDIPVPKKVCHSEEPNEMPWYYLGD